MRYLSYAILIGGLLLAAPTSAFAKTHIFACEPEWAALAKEIGGEAVSVKSATHAKQDPHHIRARPGLLASMRKADLVICSGAGLEVGWLPVLLQKSGRDTVQPGGVGHLMAADVVSVLEIPEAVDRSMGDIHPEGNPHVHLNPHNVLKVANELTSRLKQIDAAHAATYGKNHQDFSRRWKQAIARWEQQATSLKGAQIVVHHKAWTYLIDWLGLDLVATLESKPGIPPTAKHLEAVLHKTRGAKVKAIIRTPYAPDKGSSWLSEKTSIPALVLPYTVGGTKQATDLFRLFDETITALRKVRNDA